MVVQFAFLFHIYQPPVQIAPVIKKIVNESYQPIINALRANENAKITFNINATLTEQLDDYGYSGVIEGLTTLASKGQVEFTGSGKFHPLLPLIPEPEVLRQIQLNDETNRRYFGKVYNPKGFFPPEMAISEEIFPAIKKMGFDWVISSGIANTLPEFPTTVISRHAKTGLNLLFRDDYISIDCAFDKINNVDTFAQRLKYKQQDHDYYVILAMDGETFGHHVKHAIQNFLIPLFQALPHRDDIKLCTISEIIEKFPKGNSQIPRASSWSTMPYDLEQNIAFPLWFNPNNELHQYQHQFIMLALTMVHLIQKYTQKMSPDQLQLFNNARTFLDRGIHSCQQWWASKRPWYSPDMILRGLSEILLAGVNVKRSIPEDLVEDIPKTIDLIISEMLIIHSKIVISL
jgi:alpha-amylase/alpha-mannosidase (GH57 family)